MKRAKNSSAQSRMIEIYQLELKAALLKVEHLKEVLKSIGDEPAELITDMPKPKRGRPRIKKEEPVIRVKRTAKRGRRSRFDELPSTVSYVPESKVKKYSKQATSKSEPKKRGRKPIVKATKIEYLKERNSKWSNFIISALKEKDTPMTISELIKVATTKFKVSGEKSKHLKQAIQSSAFRLRSVNKRIDNFAVAGVRQKFLALSEWFSDGKITKGYKEKAIKGL